MKDITLDAKLKALGINDLQRSTTADRQEEGGPSFNDVLKKAIAEVNGLEKEADRRSSN
jgi:flagellar hook-basal body complex protein FliE